MQITRTEAPSGGPSRTRREEIVSLNTGPREVEPELIGWDFSESTDWPWDSNPDVRTWDVMIEAIRQFIAPFEGLDSQAAGEQAGGDDSHGGVYAYPFNNRFLPIGQGDDDGDLNSANFARKVDAFLKKYGKNGRPQGGTEIMESVKASDQHYMGEFAEDARGERPVRARVVFTDGALNDAAKFQQYLAQATVTSEGYGAHGDWDEVWAVAIIGEEGGGGHAAYDQYVALAKDHPWVHAYYFSNVVNAAEIAEDMAIAVVPTKA